MHEDIYSFLDQQQDLALHLQRELVARPALGPENGGQGEAEKAVFLTSELARLGFPQVRNLPAPDTRVESGQRPNLITLLPGQDPTRTLWIIAHTDVVPPGDPDLWTTDPFTLHQEGDRIIGRGVEDNHHGLVASLLAAYALLQIKKVPACNLGLLFVADEETGNTYGLEYVLQNHSQEFGPDDLFLVPDFGQPDSKMIEVAEKGLMWLKITVHGQQCHASTPQAGQNTLLTAAQCILKLRDLYTLFDQESDLFNPPFSTFECTKIEANVPNVNTIPGKDTFYCDCRVLPVYSLDRVIAQVKDILAEVSRKSGMDIDLEVLHQQAASSSDAHSPLVQGLREAIARVYKVQAVPGGIGGGTVAAYARHQGYAAAVWSTLPGNAHQPNEQTSLSTILQDAKVMADLALDSNI